MTRLIRLSVGEGKPGADGLDGEDGPAGTFLNNFQGAWDDGTAYDPGDIVTHAGSSYLALNASTGTTPVNGATWALIASKGTDGEGGGGGSNVLVLDVGDPVPDGTAPGTVIVRV